MNVRGIAAATALSIGISTAALMGVSLTPAWADAETVRPVTMFGSNGALDALSLGGIRTGLAPAPGRDDEEELRRQRPNSSDADPLKANQGAAPFSNESELSSPFTANLTLNGAPINQPPRQNPPPAANNPPLASNPPPAQSTAPVVSNPAFNSVVSSTSSIGAGVITVLRRDGLLQ